MSQIAIILSVTNALLTVDGTTHSANRGTPLYALAEHYVDAAASHADEDYLDGISDEIALEVKRKVEREKIGNVTFNGVDYFFKNQLIPAGLGKMMFTAEKTSASFKALVAFVKNVSRNPKKDIYDELYDFLAAGDMPITEDGCFLAYKKVKEDYTDYHSGRCDYTVGNVVQMPAHEADANRYQTCSRGLHFCSKSYLPSYFGSSGRIVIVKINPADVAAIPTDYHNAKGRCWYLEVVGELDKGEADQIFRPLTELADENGWRETEYDTEYDTDEDEDEDYYSEDDEEEDYNSYDYPYDGGCDDDEESDDEVSDPDLIEEFETAVSTILGEISVNANTINDYLDSTALWKFAVDSDYELDGNNDEDVARVIRAFRQWRKSVNAG